MKMAAIQAIWNVNMYDGGRSVLKKIKCVAIIGWQELYIFLNGSWEREECVNIQNKCL